MQPLNVRIVKKIIEDIEYSKVLGDTWSKFDRETKNYFRKEWADIVTRELNKN